MKIIGRIILEEQEGGYCAPAMRIEPPVGTYLEPRYLHEVFESMSGKKLNEVNDFEPELDCGLYEITIKRRK